jgi:hypothetical protein
MKDLEQLEFVFLTGKRPLSDVPRDSCGRIKQQEIQVEGVFKRGEPHPEYEGLRLLETSTRRGQRWVTAEALKKDGVTTAAYNRKYREANKDQLVEKDRKYYEANKEEITEKARKWYAANREKKRKYYEANKDQIAERSRKWREANKEKIAAKDAKRRRRLKTNIQLHKDAQKALHGVYKLRKTLDLCARGAGASSVFHVHHTWPLINEEFCGLHAPWNVEIVTVAENLRLSNRRPTTT